MKCSTFTFMVLGLMLGAVVLAQEHPLTTSTRQCFTPKSRRKFLKGIEENATKIGSFKGVSKCMRKELWKLKPVLKKEIEDDTQAEDDVLVICYRTTEILEKLRFCSCKSEPKFC